MIPIENRVQHRSFAAFAAYDTIEHVWPRVYQLVTCGRRIIYVERWLDGGGITVSPGLTVQDGGSRPGARWSKSAELSGFSVNLTPGIRSIAAGAHIDEGSEAAAAKRFHGGLDATRIQVEGFGDGRDDHIEIIRFNRHGVGAAHSLYFDFEGLEARAEREAAFAEHLAGHGDWSAGKLKTLAEHARHLRQPVTELMEGITP